MRRTTDLIEELKEAAAEDASSAACLVVGFEESAVFIWSDRTDALELLNESIEAGGCPVGIVSYQSDNDRIRSVQVRPLDEFADNEEVRQSLLDLVTRTIETAQREREI